MSPTVDAIVVPAARPGQHAREHIRLAESLGCTLVVLCSQAMTADAIVEIAARPRIPVVAIDFDRDASPLGRDVFGTSELVVGTPFWHDTDVHAKRNAALLLSQLAGWDRVFFLDDDVVIDNPDDIRTAADLLGEYAVTGLTVDGFPDLSVTGHAYHGFASPLKKFLAAGALMVAPRKRRSFFPEVYNDERLYLLDDSCFPALALTGHAIQDEYAPFEDPNRASRQEFGEVIAIGLHSGVRDGVKPRDADREFWRAFLPVRHRFLHHLMRMYEEHTTKDPDHTSIITAIRAAQDTFSLITPAFCVAYVDAWLRDRKWWVDYLDTMPDSMPTEEAVTKLGLPASVIS